MISQSVLRMASRIGGDSGVAARVGGVFSRVLR